MPADRIPNKVSAAKLRPEKSGVFVFSARGILAGMENTPTDAQLIDAVRSGRHDGFAELVRRYQGEVWKVVAGMLSGVQRSEDLVQQVFIAAFFALDSFDTTREFGPWIRTLARNEVRQYLRGLEREGRRLDIYQQQLLTHLADEEAEVRQAAREARLALCLDKLDGPVAEAVRWRYEGGQSFAEIGTRLERSAEAVRVMIGRARVILRDCIESQPA